MGGRLASCGPSHSSLTHWRPFHHTAPHCLPVEHFPTHDGPALISLPRRGKLHLQPHHPQDRAERGRGLREAHRHRHPQLAGEAMQGHHDWRLPVYNKCTGKCHCYSGSLLCKQNPGTGKYFLLSRKLIFFVFFDNVRFEHFPSSLHFGFNWLTKPVPTFGIDR